MNRGVSPAVSYVLLVALSIIVAVGAYVWGTYEVNRLQDQPIASNMEAQMVSIDQVVQSVSHGDTNFTTVIEVFYPKGVMQVDEDNDWIKWSGQLNANIYDLPIEGTANATCNSSTYLIQDSTTTVKMSRILYSNVFRGSTGDQSAQFVEIVACYTDIDITADATCRGKSGPRAQIIARKTGYNSTAGKPIVQVRVC
jgi:hypothetical protein